MSGEEGWRGFFSPWPAYPAALAAALAGQALLLAGRTAAGAALYLFAALLVLGTVDGGEVSTVRQPGRAQAALALLLILFAALLLRRMEIASIPWGLNNDEGIEGLIACRFLDGERIRPFSTIGLSRETLYHLLLMPLFRVMGPGMTALRLLSLLISLATFPVIYLAGKELFSSRAGLFSAALLAFSPWHVLYSRTGFRSILLPLFVVAALLSFHRALRSRRLPWFLLTGAVLGIGMYSYTSFRIVPPVLLAWGLLRCRVLRRPPLSWKETAAVVLPFLLLLVPQIQVALESPGEFLARGSYVLTQTPRASLGDNLLYSLLMPLVYPARYGVMQSLYYFGDGVSLVYAAVGRTPETAVSAALMACGILLAAARFIRRRQEGDGALLLCFGTTLAVVGLAGPSLTRLMGNLPLLCLAAGSFLEETGRALGRRFTPAAARGATVLLLVLAGGLCYEQYFLRAGTSPRAMFYYAAPETVMGLYAVSRPPDLPVTVLYTEEPETLEFLTYPRRRWVRLERDPSRIDPESIRSAGTRQELIVEYAPRFAKFFERLKRAFPGAGTKVLSDTRRPREGTIALILDLPGASGGKPPFPAAGPLPTGGKDPSAR